MDKYVILTVGKGNSNLMYVSTSFSEYSEINQMNEKTCTFEAVFLDNWNCKWT